MFHSAFRLLPCAMASVSMAAWGQTEPTPTLETVTISDTRERAYRAIVAPTANKSDTTVKETPFSIQTVTRELMEDRGVTSFGEAVRTVPGLVGAPVALLLLYRTRALH